VAHNASWKPAESEAWVTCFLVPCWLSTCLTTVHWITEKKLLMDLVEFLGGVAQRPSN